MESAQTASTMRGKDKSVAAKATMENAYAFFPEQKQFKFAALFHEVLNEREKLDLGVVCTCAILRRIGVQHETSLEGPILEDVEETIAREEVDLGISPPNTELDEGEFEDLDIEHRRFKEFLKDFKMKLVIEYNG
ncbi:hypothetical protein Tco_0664134 [Tanacetum coccineum]